MKTFSHHTHEYNEGVKVTFVELAEEYPETNYEVLNFCSATASERNSDLENIFMKMFPFVFFYFLVAAYTT